MSTTTDTLRLYSQSYRKHPWLFLGTLLMGPGFVLQNIVSPLFIAKILGQLANHQIVNTNYVLYAGISLLSGLIVSNIGDRYASMPLTALTMHDLYRKCVNRLMKQDYDFFANSFAGSLVTQANRLSKSYEIFVNTVYLEMLGIWFGVLTAIGIMIHYDATIGLTIGALWVVSIIIVMLLVRRRIPIRRAAVSKESELTGEIADIITNAVTIKTFAHEIDEEARYDKTNSELSARLHRSWRAAIGNHFIIQILCILIQLVVLVGGIHAVQHGTLTIATFLLFQVYILRIIDSISKSSLEMRLLEGIFSDSAEMTELLSRVPAVNDSEKPINTKISHGVIQFSDVQFAYDTSKQKSHTLFDHLDMTIKAGERVGLVGPSGGGKTTITKLLLRFMDIQSGSITIDKQDVRTMRQDDLHRAISYVPQEPLLFHRSLLENISYGKQGAKKSEIIAAAKRAHAHEFISSLPEGYETLVGERGIKLSGGQRQRVAIARAILKNAPLLVLDEATSALDSESERYIQSALWELMDGKTSVVIAHRLSTIQHLDRIIVLDDGKVIEQGSHAELLKQNGLYAKLWAHQSGGFIEE